MALVDLRAVWLALACSAAACEKQAPSAAPSPPPPAPPSPAPSPPPPPAPVAPADPAPAPAGAPVQTPPATPAVPSIDFGTVPDFGCLAWSRARELAACVVGERGYNVGDTKVTLVFMPLGGADAPAPLALLDLQEQQPGPDALPAGIAKAFEDSLRGFTPLERTGPSITLSSEGTSLVEGSPLSVGGMRVELRGNRAPPLSIAPAYHSTLTVRGPDGSRRLLNDLTTPSSSFEVRAFPLRDRGGRSVVIVEQVYGIGDEGVMGARGAAWRCSAKECQDF